MNSVHFRAVYLLRHSYRHQGFLFPFFFNTHPWARSYGWSHTSWCLPQRRNHTLHNLTPPSVRLMRVSYVIGLNVCGEVLDSYTSTRLHNSELQPRRETGQHTSRGLLSITAVNTRGAASSHERLPWPSKPTGLVIINGRTGRTVGLVRNALFSVDM